MAHEDRNSQGVLGRVLRTMIEHPGVVLAAVLVISAFLLVGGITSAPDEDVSFNPSGEEFDTEEIVDRTFRPSTSELLFIVVDEGADVLDVATLREWWQNSEALRTDEELSDELSVYYDDELGVTVTGTYSIADAVHEELLSTGVDGGLENATDDETKLAVSNVLAEGRPTAAFRDDLSIHTDVAEGTIAGSSVEVWTSPAFLTEVRVDHDAFPVDLEEETDPATRTDAQQDDIDAERGLDIEEYARDAQDVLRGDENEFQAWGVAIDETLTDDESFNAALPYLLGAFTLIVLLVGLLLRSYWAAALAGVGLALTMLWGRMLANLAGFEESIIVDVIVPIATISFGVDFMIHAVGRCREELAEGRPHRSAYVVGIATVGGALALAFSTSSIAFGSNATSGIPGVIQFGLAAAIALGCAFIMLGLLAPLFLLRIEESLAGASPPGTGPLARITAGLRMLVPSVAASLIIIGVIGVPFIGAVGSVVYMLLLIALPLWWTRRAIAKAEAPEGSAEPNLAGQSMARAGTVVAGLVRLRYVALVLIAAITVVAVIGALDVDSKTEPNDFYPSDSDLVVSIDKVLEHSESIGGDGILLYLEGEDLAEPQTLEAAEAMVNSVGMDDVFAHNPDGSFVGADSGLDVARAAVGVEYARDTIASATGVTLSDSDGDGFPDSGEQTSAVFEYATANGVPADESTFVYTSDEVGRLLGTHNDAWATTLRFPIPGFPSASTVSEARTRLETGEAEFREALDAEGLSVETSISGGSLTQQLRIDAITDSMLVSVPAAMVLCLIAAALVMRSLRLSLVTIVPIALVIAWLLGFMRAFDYSLNVVTATIAAISVGVGIDYAIHFTMRFREEHRRLGDRLDAIRSAAEGTGAALFLSALTSVTGFALLALAPMPVLAAYGLLTAVMIALSLLASLTVLPMLLYMVTPSASPEGEGGREPLPVSGGDR